MTKAATNRRMMAEWENPERIFLAFPNHNTDWKYILPEARKQYLRLLQSLGDASEKIMVIADSDTKRWLSSTLEGQEIEIIDNIDYNDTWTRDYGLISVEDNGQLLQLDFGFNGWGLKFAADKDNLVNMNLAAEEYINGTTYINFRDFTLEGGSIESDGKGVILTTSRCLCSSNRNGGKSKAEIEEILKTRLGAKKILWLDYGFLEGDDTDSHIDTLARLAPNDTIIYVGAPDNPEDVHFEQMKEMEKQLQSFTTLEGNKFRLLRLPFPDPIYDEEGMRLPATYANYLVTGKNVFIPTYEQPEKDAEAIRIIREAFPDHDLHGVECLTLIRQHGSLHCSTMQLYHQK